ncbi:MAG: ABC transporter substrate-binding protein, partial [Candidatus Gracilibacteria bacterium]
FHDGSMFDSEDVMASVKRAKENKNSDLVGMLSTVDSVEKIDDLTLRMKTFKPDPLLLQKLALLMIVPSEAGGELAGAPVGTGPYKFAFWDKSGEQHKIILEAFDERAKFKTVQMISEVDKFIRTKMLMDGETDLLTFVPFDAVEILKEKGFMTEALPSLEVQFLVFNFKSKYFSNLENRKLVSLVVDQDYLVEAVGGFARKVSQFVSNGNFGFSAKIAEHDYDLEKAKALNADVKGQTISIHLATGLDLLGEHLRKQLKEVGVSAVVSYMDGEKLLESMKNGDADLYFLALKSDLGDSASFFEDVALSSGKFNIARYLNPALDELVERSSIEMDPELRLKNLQEAMGIVTQDYFGVPMFEYETVYGLDSKFDFKPRIDGMIYFEDVTKKSGK